MFRVICFKCAFYCLKCIVDKSTGGRLASGISNTNLVNFIIDLYFHMPCKYDGRKGSKKIGCVEDS